MSQKFYMLKWTNVKDAMPERNKYVLVETPYCKYKFATAYWNGINWISVDDETVTLNVEFWTEVKTPESL
jgi:hypothetical protein